MTKPTERRPFVGVDKYHRQDGCVLPKWYRDVVKATIGQAKEARSFNETLRTLPTATRTRVAYFDTEADEWREDEDHVAIVNPAWLGDGLPTDDPTRPDTAVWNIPTERYTIVNPMDAYGPLGAVIRQRLSKSANEQTDGLGCVFGEMRLFRNGGEVHMDILFDGLRVADPDGPGKPFVLGITTGYDFFGGRALYARPMAYDSRTGTAMRNIAPKRKRKHTGAAGASVSGWWGSVLNQLDDVSETLFGAIVDARAHEIDVDALYTNFAGFYDALGYPDYVAESAADKLGDGRTTASAWELYYALATTLTEAYSGKDTGALEGYVATANTLLFCPPRAERTVIEHMRDTLRNQQTLTSDEEEQLNALREAGENAKQSVSKFRTAKQRLNELMREASA